MVALQLYGMYFLVQAQIPNADTTYWCAAYELPQEVQQQERYIIRVSTWKYVVNVVYRWGQYQLQNPYSALSDTPAIQLDSPVHYAPE